MKSKLIITVLLTVVIGTLGILNNKETPKVEPKEPQVQEDVSRGKPQEVVIKEANLREQIAIFGDMQMKNHPQKCLQVEKIIKTCQDMNNRGCEYNFIGIKSTFWWKSEC